MGVKDGKIDVTQKSAEDMAAEAEAEGGVGTVSAADTGNLFSFMLARAGVKSRAFETDVRAADTANPLLAGQVLQRLWSNHHCVMIDCGKVSAA